MTPKVEAPLEDADVDLALALEAALSSGDRQRALTILMTRYGDDVYRYARAMTGDGQLAEEVRQQTFVQTYRDLPRFAGNAPVRAWLFAIVRNRSLDAIKASKRWRLRYKNEPPDEPAVDDFDPDDRIDRRRLARFLVRCLSRLAPAAREAVLLRYQQELPYDEAAAITGERPGTLQQRVARALPVLRRCVEAQLRPGVPG